MDIHETELPGVLVFRPKPHRDDRGFFSRTYDDESAARWGIVRSDFVQDSQSRSTYGVLRGLHGRGGASEAKIVRVARGSAFFAVLDARPESPTLGRHVTVTLDDVDLASLYVPRRLFTGFQVTSDVADICYSIDREHSDAEKAQIRHDDPELGIAWPLPPENLSERDRTSPLWGEYLRSMGIDPAHR